MISFLRGAVVEVLPMRLILDVGGVGYDLNIPLSTYDKLPPPGSTATVLTHLVVREDAHTLYGFATPEERDLFLLLVNNVSGIGPKLALAVLNGIAPVQFRGLVVAGDIASLSKIKGVGKKTAERIVVELRDKVGVSAAWEAASAKQALTPEEAHVNDAVLALISLGFKQGRGAQGRPLSPRRQAEGHGRGTREGSTQGTLMYSRLVTLFILLLSAIPSPAETPAPNSGTGSAQPLDLSRFYTKQYQAPDGSDSKFKGYAGRKMIDGLPFDIGGQISLYGKETADRGTTYAQAVSGIPIGRKFDELHLIHIVEWREYPGCPVATLRLHYADDTSADIPIRYGVHVIDWCRLDSEDAESLTDPHTKIIWRGPGGALGPVRLFKSEINNPFPHRTVKTLDLISTDSGSNYDLVAATVAMHDPKRALTPPLPLLPARNFAGAMTVCVIDKQTGEPIEGAEIYPAMVIGNFSLVANNAITGKDGTAVVKYPKDAKLGAKDLRIKITKPGYSDCELHWSTGWQAGQIPDDITYRLAPNGATGDNATPDFSIGAPVRA